MGSIQDELEEAAVIDGCSVFSVYIKIILPLTVPAIVTVTILNFLNGWNNLLFPLILLNKDSLKPIALGLLSFFGERQSDYSGVMSAIVITGSKGTVLVLPFLFWGSTRTVPLLPLFNCDFGIKYNLYLQ